MDIASDFEPISRAKVTPTPVRPETLHRERLLEWLSGHARRRLELIVADAGYGKTTLVADYAQRAATRCLWLKLEHTDGDWITYINYLVAAYAEAVPGFGHRTLPLMATSAAIRPSRETVLGTFMAELSKLADAPLTLILDDYHLVDEAADVRLVMDRLLRDAPPSLTFVVLTRRRPELSIGGLRAAGEVVELTTDDMRFTRHEIGRLFAESYGQPFEDDVLDEVERRTLGWGACLQLLRPTLRGRSNIEVRKFVMHLSGAAGPIYDFLAEEVLREADPEMRRFLICTSLLDRFVPEHVAAIFAADDPAPTDEILRSRLEEAYESGLIGRGDLASGGFRFHPLLREFLSRQLATTVSADDLVQIHLRIARAAEDDAWLASCRHYLAADHDRDAARVLVRSVLVAVGTGTWGAAAEIVGQLADQRREPEIEVILALKQVEDGQIVEALDRLEDVDESTVSPAARALLRYGRYRASWWSNNQPDAIQALRELRTDPETPAIIREIAETHLMLFGADRVDLARAARVLSQAAQAQAAGGLHFFAGITQHNAMAVALARGRAKEALDFGNQALIHLRDAGSAPHGIHATHALLASCHGELGHRAEAQESIALALAEAPQDLDAYAEAAYYLAGVGSVERADETLRAALELERSSPTDQMQRTGLALARARLNIAAGRPLVAEAALGSLEPAGIAAKSAVLYLRALSAIAVGQGHVAIALALAGLHESQAEGSRRWGARLAVVHAAAALDGNGLTGAIHDARAVGQLGLVDCAEAIVSALHLLDPLPAELDDSIAKFPDAWLPALRRRLGHGLSPEGVAAARILDQHGERSDVHRLRAYERTYLPGSRSVGLGRKLSRRTAPRLHIHDLGPGWFEVGDRAIRLTSIRRRAATVLGFLLTRPHATATREQILDAMWPDLDPEAALNSLNQTLYFLRRDIEAGYDDDVSVSYVRLEGELIWLDLDLIDSDSATFADSAAAAIAGQSTRLDRTIESVRSYSGRFLPEFEYEEWAIGWRERLHGAFLHLVDVGQVELVRLHRQAEAIDVTLHALSVDPSNAALERALVWLYSSVGSNTAAREQYQHYATSFRNEVGAEPPSIEELLSLSLVDFRDG